MTKVAKILWRVTYDPANKKKAKTKKQLKIEDFRHAGNKNKQSRQNHQNIFYSSAQKKQVGYRRKTADWC